VHALALKERQNLLSGPMVYQLACDNTNEAHNSLIANMSSKLY